MQKPLRTEVFVAERGPRSGLVGPQRAKGLARLRKGLARLRKDLARLR